MDIAKLQPHLKTGEDSLKLFTLTVAAGSGVYFAGKTVLYIGNKFLSTRFGSTVAKIVSWPFKQFWFALCWMGRGIKNLAFWAFSCIRHPIESLKSTFNRIRSVVSFIFSWTILLAYQKTTAFINHYLPSMRPALLTTAIAAPIAFAASFFSHHDYDSDPVLETVLIKSIVILAGSLIAAPYLSQKFTSFSVSRLEAGAWGAVQGTLFFALAMSNTLEDPS